MSYFHSAEFCRRAVPSLRSLSNPVHAGIAHRAGSAGSRSAVLHRDLLGVLNLPCLPALHAVSSHLLNPPNGYVPFMQVAGLVYDAGSSGDKLTLDRSISFLHSVPPAIPQALRGIDFTPAPSTIASKIQAACTSGERSSGVATWVSPPRCGRLRQRKPRGNSGVSPENTAGATWTRPRLDLTSRCICNTTCLAALGREGPL